LDPELTVTSVFQTCMVGDTLLCRSNFRDTPKIFSDIANGRHTQFGVYSYPNKNYFYATLPRPQWHSKMLGTTRNDKISNRKIFNFMTPNLRHPG